MDDKPFDTREALLALCLILAGQEPADQHQPVFNKFDEEILFNIGGGKRDPKTHEVIKPSRFTGMTLEQAANEAWREGAKGDVGYVLKMTPRLLDLIRAYRQQCVTIEHLDLKASELIIALLSDASAGIIQPDELILRISCVILKTRGQFVNLWKEMVPLLYVPDKGRSKTSDGTQVSKGKIVPSKVVEKPGFKLISLNISDEHRKQMKL